ncbi:hypothetical protein BE08_32895 [Sorangium cellulosum]|uniref:Uncharacterized protein n=1 Tax=Sorangium cellulosum TaxID=56 RepID=A0A150PUF1_SORCE|nr:hypothetical protein BE08_32895 [Sorangium cellulosum]
MEGLTAQLREALGQTRVVSPRTIEAHAERALLEHRHFQEKLVMGELRLRALLSPPGGHVKVPVYWPEAVGKELPGFQRMQVRTIAALGMRTCTRRAQAALCELVRSQDEDLLQSVA